jgi:hypothetical protein
VSEVKYIDLTHLSEAARQALFAAEASSGVTYIREDGTRIESSQVHHPNGRRELTETAVVAGWAPIVIEKKRGRPSKMGQRETLLQRYPEWVVSAVEAEMGKPCGEGLEVEFEACLAAVAKEKGWIIR